MQALSKILHRAKNFSLQSCLRRDALRLNTLLLDALRPAALLLATLVSRPWHLYATLGVMVGGGSVCLGFTGQGLFLPNWFVRRRGLAMSLAFSGVGVGSVILLPWMQSLIGRFGWRTACWAVGGQRPPRFLYSPSMPHSARYSSTLSWPPWWVRNSPTSNVRLKNPRSSRTLKLSCGVEKKKFPASSIVFDSV